MTSPVLIIDLFSILYYLFSFCQKLLNSELRKGVDLFCAVIPNRGAVLH